VLPPNLRYNLSCRLPSPILLLLLQEQQPAVRSEEVAWAGRFPIVRGGVATFTLQPRAPFMISVRADAPLAATGAPVLHLSLSARAQGVSARSTARWQPCHWCSLLCTKVVRIECPCRCLSLQRKHCRRAARTC